ncbi:carboxymuconolactone decarboxylase family protein [Amycolatopsis endophytica]|uniref:AhpD family alkylhydroperoxidase n=1 Tax=Amycolatopsis endophytica TaxID=860233 RepID=A0A853AWU7_9PSEU|nr:carboxymuconolactone decarboxylase family protein [Amycolatopsis endophytica]NYI87138.1 AhpD family alkylhydroperoxidase [Amycolatopsis endophytica]
MARLEYVDSGSEIADRIRARRGGRLRPLDGMLLHSPPFADGWNSLLGAIRGQGELSGDLRELAVLRVAELNGAEYEWAAHEPVAKEEGMTVEQIAALRDGGDRGVLTERQRVVLDYTDAMTGQVTVPDELFAALHEHLDPREIVELTVTVAAYNMVSRFLVALEVGS